MAKLVVRDTSGQLEKYARKVMKRYKGEFRALKHLKILYLWRLGDNPRYDDEGEPIAAQTRKLPTRERDVYEVDVEIEVFKQSWRRRGKNAKIRLMYHELRHISVEEGENFKVSFDDDGRVVFETVKHDLVVKTFEDEVKRFGLANRDVSSASVLSQALKKKRKKLKKEKL